MSEIHLLHGCAPEWREGVQTVRNYVAANDLRRYLEARQEKYGLLSEASSRDVLTVDDATMGGARACLLAREAGHEVTIFINPAQIERQRPYWFSRLDAILDARTVASVVFDGEEFSLQAGAPLRRFRLAMKAKLMAMEESRTDALLDHLATVLGAVDVSVPEHASTLTVQMVHELIARGACIGSHGWDHRDIASMRSDELVADLDRAARWFESRLGFIPEHYAVPYGLASLETRGLREVAGMILLAHPQRARGALGDRCWNRRDIAAEVRGASA